MKEAPINVEEFKMEILKALSRKFLYLNDERDSRYGMHEVNDVVMITMLGLLSKCDKWGEIYVFAVEHYEWLKKFLNLCYSLPSKSTIMRVMAMIDFKELENICVNFILERTVMIENNCI